MTRLVQVVNFLVVGFPKNIMNYELAALWNFGQPLSLKYKIACYLQKAFSWQVCFTTALFFASGS